MHARIIATSRVAARTAAAAARAVRAPATAAPRSLAPPSALRLLSSTRCVRSEPPASSPSSAAPPGADEARSAPEESPAPIDQQVSTELPTEEIPAVSSSLDATAQTDAKVAAAEPSAEEIAEKVSRTVFVAGLSWSVDEEVLREEILRVVEAEEGVNQVRIATDPAGRSKGFAFVELASTDLTQQLLRSPTFVIDDREAVVRPSKSPVGTTPPRGSSTKKHPIARAPNARFPPGPTIYVGNVAWSADEIALEEVFSRYGNIKRINQPKDGETGRSTGVAFVEFEDLNAAQKAFRAGNGRGIRVDGRPVRVDFAKNGSHTDGARTTSAAGGQEVE
ncbi:hypothetical protein JCM8202_003193 [Rhodotorula sphaerocarpa]